MTSVATTLPAGTDTQSFCYDEQNRLTWATSQSASGPCGAHNTAGTLTSAAYTQSFAYDVLDRLTSGPGGSYTYGAWAQHLHAVTAIGSAYTASYDASGDMLCRAPISGTTCSTTPTTGAQLTYDAEGRLSAWQDRPLIPHTTVSYLYDGAGQRVEEQIGQSGTTTTSTFVGGESHPLAVSVAVSGGGTTVNDYFYGPDGHTVAVQKAGTLSYLGQDGLGSTSVALSTGGTLTASQLYAPYGAVRYTSGSMPTSYGYTGQRTSVTGLEDDGARQYDTSAGQFASADTVNDGLNRYGYVGGNPESRTDPTGHRMVCGIDCTGGGGGGGCGSNCPPTPCTSNCNPGGPGGGSSPGCGTYTQAQCDQARSAQLAAVSDARKKAGGYQILVGALGLLVDILAIKKDLASFSLDAVLNIATDIAGFITDIGSILEAFGNGLAGFFGDNATFAGMRQIGQTMATIGGIMKAVIGGIKAAPGFWINIAKASAYALILASTVEIEGELEGTTELVNAIVGGVSQAFGSKRDLLAIGQALLGGWEIQAADQGTQADDWAGETPYGFCTSDARTSACPSAA